MNDVLPQNDKYLRDAFGSPLGDGACVLEGAGRWGTSVSNSAADAAQTRRTGTAGSASPRHGRATPSEARS